MAGIHGMNINHMPERIRRWGYPAEWLLIIGIVVVMIVFLEARFPLFDKNAPDNPSLNLPDRYSSDHWILIHRISPDRLESFKNALVKKYLFFSISLLIIIAPGSLVMALETTRRKAQDTQLANLAMVDALTGLPNRRAFVEKLQMDIARAIRHERKIGLLSTRWSKPRMKPCIRLKYQAKTNAMSHRHKGPHGIAGYSLMVSCFLLVSLESVGSASIFRTTMVCWQTDHLILKS